MELLYSRCCGLDVHKSSITACVLLAQPAQPLKHIRRFGCTTRELRELAVWLQEFGVEHVAMESTGGRRCQIPPQGRRFSFAGAKVNLHQALDGRVSLYYGETKLQLTVAEPG